MTSQPSEHEPRTHCAYCGKDFDSEDERGKHISKKHVEEDDKYMKEPEAEHNPYKNLVDEWKESVDGSSERRGMA